MNRRRALLLPLSLAALALSSCASAPEEAASAPGAEAGEALTVLASFYPLEYVAERVGGERVQVSSLTPAGADPHDVELSPAAVEQLRTADAVVHLSGFQPAVDDAVAETSPEHVLDAAVAGVEGVEDHSAEEHGHAGADGPDDEHDEHAQEAHGPDEHGPDEHAHEGADPHFWLDPQRLAAVATEVAHVLGEADPEHAGTYEANAGRLTTELEALDREFSEGLRTCERRTVVVSHDAYGYLAERYDLEQVAVAGFEPETEPSPARLAEIGRVVEAEGVTTVFSESLVEPAVAETLAAEHGIGTAVLDPVEGLADPAKDYQQLMRENLEALRAALAC
ncbi:metal ABC transporter substrate-binding protein [Kocuria sp. M1R5S2]|uniref:metal ABC transporter substrate-binding protein n=1 Tax=Kocuria rhizosphaerae TaxID=3376285 RepID=UPI0037A7422B